MIKNQRNEKLCCSDKYVIIRAAPPDVAFLDNWLSRQITPDSDKTSEN
jgi:hypothetical protein